MDSPLSMQGLYVHVPFCARKCVYCAFYSEPTDGGRIQRYLDGLFREMELVPRESRPETVFFGGGTPSLLSVSQWVQVFERMRTLGWTGASEWTVECNPATVSADKARLWIEAGVNRVSLGVQSLDERLLDRLGRVHSRSMVYKSFDILRRAGFENLNLDLMFAIPGQTMEAWKATLAEAMAMQSEHVACYEVIYEEDTPLFQQLASGEVETDEDLACRMYEHLLEATSAHGLRQYEVANFARGKADPGVRDALDAGTEGWALPRYACRHNSHYWRGGSYRGLGPSACSFVQGKRTRNVASVEDYCARLERGHSVVESVDELPRLRRAGEIAAFGLRMNIGWPFSQFQEVTGFDLRDYWGEAMRELERLSWAVVEPDRFRLTPLGMRFADAAAQSFLS